MELHVRKFLADGRPDMIDEQIDGILARFLAEITQEHEIFTIAVWPVLQIFHLHRIILNWEPAVDER